MVLMKNFIMILSQILAVAPKKFSSGIVLLYKNIHNNRQPFNMRLCNGVHEKNQHRFVIKNIAVVMNTFIR